MRAPLSAIQNSVIDSIFAFELNGELSHPIRCLQSLAQRAFILILEPFLNAITVVKEASVTSEGRHIVFRQESLHANRTLGGVAEKGLVEEK